MFGTVSYLRPQCLLILVQILPVLGSPAEITEIRPIYSLLVQSLATERILIRQPYLLIIKFVSVTVQSTSHVSSVLSFNPYNSSVR